MKIWLNIFAGQLFFSSFDEYTKTCEALSLAWHPARGEMVVEADGFVSRNEDATPSKFTKSPIPFLSILLVNIRRDCADIQQTHWGKILDGLLLNESDFV
ncbi:hypothetical protein HIM_09564 [Hirsutella minnesotensis 3608]|uniref:Uncharacterized protein n=1 Tax=Hirsutella minnesotensis 3608 TaxID=1043627 RepID=A0A0F7ZXN6_9HYPO|nr:hypothetical protein HIM_09564 [Hirsutella minnesotensis 3608]